MGSDRRDVEEERTPPARGAHDRLLGEPGLDVDLVVRRPVAVGLHLAVVVELVSVVAVREGVDAAVPVRPPRAGPRSGRARRTRSGTCRCGSCGIRRAATTRQASRGRRTCSSRPRGSCSRAPRGCGRSAGVVGGPRRAAEREVHDRRRERGGPSADQPPHLGQRVHGAEVLVVGHDDDHVGPRRLAGLCGCFGAPREGESQKATGDDPTMVWP